MRLILRPTPEYRDESGGARPKAWRGGGRYRTLGERKEERSPAYSLLWIVVDTEELREGESPFFGDVVELVP